MCDEFTELSYLNTYRRIRICEHQTVWLYWDQALMFLHLSDLEMLNTVLDHAVAGLAVDGSPAVAIQCVGKDYYLLNVRSFAFYLTWEEMADMAELVCIAADNLTPTTTVTSDTMITHYHDPLLDSTVHISLN
jgi:hypothetical protein